MNLRSLLDKLDRAAAYLQSPLLLVLRLYWGCSFAQGGWGKLTHLERTTSYFESLGLPMPKLNAIAAASVECFGGALLALGLFARPISIPLIFTMIVAYFTAHTEELHAIFSEPDKFLGADPFLYLLTSVIVLAFGPGKFSLDALFFGKSSAGK